jgi:putative transposase
MPRNARVILPGYPHHIVQRGHNRQVVFAEPRDYLYYLNTLKVWKSEYEVRLYAYCLMTNHAHLIMEPVNDAAIGQLMKRLAGRQTRYVNRLESRRGTLWEGRYKSSPIDTDNYLLACCRYVELNPVRARMVSKPEDYCWSSYRERLGLPAQCKILDITHADGARLPETFSNLDAYVQFLTAGIPPAETTLIRTSLKRGQLTGDTRFIDEVEGIIGRRIEHRGPGRAAATIK